jgi:hypothetical protein
MLFSLEPTPMWLLLLLLVLLLPPQQRLLLLQLIWLVGVMTASVASSSQHANARRWATCGSNTHDRVHMHGRSWHDTSHECATGVYQQHTAGVLHHASSMVPVLAILGRVCLYTAHLAACALQSGAGEFSSGEYRAEVVAQAEGLLAFVEREVVSTLRGWLAVPKVERAWASVGFDAPAVQGKVCACIRGTTSAMPTAAVHALGRALNSLAFPYACNSATCTNLSGPQELQLVNGRCCMCGGCRVAHYCSKECQKQHWKTHKPVCEAVKAAAAAAAKKAE